jgi:SWI/SNF-related matrix-associated actin-dependent regulator 1 of chromatin subfamily A
MTSTSNFNAFAYNESEPDTPIVKKNVARTSAAGKHAKKTVLLSSDDEEVERSSSNIAASTVTSSGSSPWLETRNPSTISPSEKVANISTAISQRKVIRSLIPKKLIPGMPPRVDIDEDEDEKKEPSVTTVDMKKLLSKSNLIRDSLLDKALDDNYDPLEEFRMKNAALRAKERENRIANRTNNGSETTTKLTNKRRLNLDSDSDDDGAPTPRSNKQIKNTIDLTDSPTPVAVKEKKQKRVKEQFVEVNDSDDGGWNEEMTKAELKNRASQIISHCESVSSRLRKSLQQWEGNRSSSRIGGQNQTSDCVNLIAIDQSVAKTADGNYSTNGQKSVLSDEDIAMCCPGLKLNGYQLVGVNWLKLLYENKVNGVLADDMGLGKTVQTISFLGWLSLHYQLSKAEKQQYQEKDQDHHQKRPHLIVVPASTLSNWQNEFKKFCPSLVVHTYHGTQNERTELRYLLKSLIPKGEVDVILSTYTIFEREACKQDRGFIYSQKFNFLVLDEAHCIKNADSSRYSNLNAIKTNHRLLLSGTPVQNNLSELLAMLSFLMPSVFGREDCELMMEAFGWQKESMSSNGNNDALSLKQLKSMLAPFVLRRLKRDVLDQLTDKHNELRLLEMPEMQKNIYEGIINRYTTKKNKLAKGGSSGDEGKDITEEDVLNNFSGTEAKHLFTALRKAANHPLLLRVHYVDENVIQRVAHKAYEGGHFGDKCTFDRVLQEMETFSDYDIHQLCLQYSGLEKYQLSADTLYDSPKMQHLRQLLPELQSQGHRMLLFSQWTRLLDLLEILLQDMGMRFLRLDGSTPIAERQMLIDTYSTDLTIPVFLLSTKAGGLGINLTAADTVILHDLDFNPENDRQAEDRVYRIGQTRPVTIYRLVCKGTVDEDIYEMGERKRKLSQAVLSDHRSGEGSATPKKKSAAHGNDDDLNLIGKILSKALNKHKH